MESKKTTTRRRTRPEAPAGGGPTDGPGASSGNLLDQARGWGEVAREAHDECEKGENAEAELHRRRNNSGQ